MGDQSDKLADKLIANLVENRQDWQAGEMKHDRERL
jgi:hypothetical protein